MKNMYPNLILTIGISGSGKSAYLKKHFKKEEILSADELRKVLCGNVNDQSKNSSVWRIIKETAVKMIEEKYPRVVIDGINVVSKDRTRFLKNFKDLECITTALVFKPDLEISLKRIEKDIKNNINRAAVEKEVLEKQYKAFKAGYENIKNQFDEIIEV